MASLLHQLAVWHFPALVYADGLDGSLKHQFTGVSLHFVDQPLDMRQVGAECDLGVSNANHSTTATLLQAARPLLLLPLALEQFLLAQRLARQGLAVMVHPNAPQTVDRALREAFESATRYRAAARRFAERYANFDIAGAGLGHLRSNRMAIPASSLGSWLTTASLDKLRSRIQNHLRRSASFLCSLARIKGPAVTPPHTPPDPPRMLAEVSAGELLDKITILEIKRGKFQDAAKLAHVAAELEALVAVRDRAIALSPELTGLIAQLHGVNLALWEIEDEIREHERHGAFDARFIELARAVYHQNDRRAALRARDQSAAEFSAG